MRLFVGQKRQNKHPDTWLDPATLYARQEIADRTGVSDDVLSFWTKRGLLMAAQGGEGKGSHRRFAFPQVNIAAIYAVFRDHFGANVATLSSLAALFQRSVTAFERAPIYVGDWDGAASLAQALSDFRSGKTVMVDEHDIDDPDYDSLSINEKIQKRPARNEAEVIGTGRFSHTDTPFPALLRFAEALGPGRYQEARVAQALLGTILAPTYMGDVCWLMRQTEDGWDIRDSSEDMNFSDINAGEFGPGVFIPVGSIIRKIWDMPDWRALRRRRQAKVLEVELDKWSINATLTPRGDEEEGFDIHIHSGSRKKAEEVLFAHGYTMPLKAETKQ
jgi:hypothetical protein